MTLIYTGVTNDLERRVKEHENGNRELSYTNNRKPLKLVFYKEFDSAFKAIEFEKQIKGWTRSKKEALIDGDWNRLKELAKCKNETSHLNYKEKESCLSPFVFAQDDGPAHSKLNEKMK